MFHLLLMLGDKKFVTKELSKQLGISRRSFAEAEYIGCHPCINTSSLKIKTSDILEKFLKCTGHDYKVVNL